MPRRVSYAILTAVAGLAACAGGCGEPLRPPFAQSVSFQVSSPRLLRAGEEIGVPLVVTNNGLRAWNPERVHVSYHWLWFVPRELASRSRNVPYQDGIRTDLGRSIEPGAAAHLDGRVLAPSWPGLYWLQWDAVEESVTWFSQVSPRQARTLVVVLPTAFAVFAPVPLLIALFGIYAIGRIERRRDYVDPGLVRFAVVADVWWAAGTLFCKPFELLSQALLEPTPVAIWLMVVAAVAPVLLIALLFNRRARGWPLFALGALATVLMLADLIYFRFFGDMLSVPALFAIGQTPRVIATIRSLFTARLLWMVIDVPFAAWLMVRMRATWAFDRKPARRPWPQAVGAIVALGATGLALSAPQVISAAELDRVFRNRAVMEQLGPFGFHLYDLLTYTRATLLRAPATEEEINSLARWFADRAPLRAGDGSRYFGAARGKNLIVIQVESLQDFMVDYRVGGQEVMPHLRQWTADSWRFTNVTDQTNEGRTSDAEFTTMVSLLPLDHGAVSFRFPENAYVGFPSVLASHGYSTSSAVAFEAGFWNRRVMHPRYGFSHSFFEPDFTMTEQIGWGLNDHDFLQQMVPHLQQERQPFCAWLITLSLHHPFESFPDAHKTLKLGPLEGTPFGNYLHTMRFFDQALDDFKTSLARAGLLDDTVIVVFGDHDAGFPRDVAMSHTIGIGEDDVSWALADRVPLFIRVPGVTDDGAARVRPVDTPAGQTDLAPTLLGLLGI
ncbi:MAG TPA: sulfatase-like hydrolase/transferase, partial [Vicinamibacterales bacterium]|nr:sulfatase-like hydrolase/transferase [Vicinamibacterales bacterium]